MSVRASDIDAATQALIEALPESLREMAQACGFGPVMSLVEWRGGTGLYVPHNASAEHELVRRLGLAPAGWLIDRYGGEILTVPRAAAYLRSLRDAEIRRRHCENGVSAARLALDYGLTERQVWRILAKTSTPADSQISLI